MSTLLVWRVCLKECLSLSVGDAQSFWITRTVQQESLQQTASHLNNSFSSLEAVMKSSKFWHMIVKCYFCANYLDCDGDSS